MEYLHGFEIKLGNVFFLIIVLERAKKEDRTANEGFVAMYISVFLLQRDFPLLWSSGEYKYMGFFINLP